MFDTYWYEASYSATYDATYIIPNGDFIGNSRTPVKLIGQVEREPEEEGVVD